MRSINQHKCTNCLIKCKVLFLKKIIIIIIINAQTDTRLQFSLYSNYLIGLHLLALANTWVDVISH